MVMVASVFDITVSPWEFVIVTRGGDVVFSKVVGTAVMVTPSVVMVVVMVMDGMVMVLVWLMMTIVSPLD